MVLVARDKKRFGTSAECSHRHPKGRIAKRLRRGLPDGGVRYCTNVVRWGISTLATYGNVAIVITIIAIYKRSKQTPITFCHLVRRTMSCVFARRGITVLFVTMTILQDRRTRNSTFADCPSGWTQGTYFRPNCIRAG